jgi:hypothetical protein
MAIAQLTKLGIAKLGSSIGFSLGICLGLSLGLALSVIAENLPPAQADRQRYINQRVCPADLTRLSAALAKDLPDYLNRGYSRLRIRREVIAISQPELEPLPLAPDQLSDRLSHQIFLSVLERPTGKVNSSQRAYWLFLVFTSKGWRLDMAFMRIGTAPPVDVSDAAIADATNKWLRDHCDRRYRP